MADPYSVLGVDKSADDKAIKAAYRKLAKQFHPDANTGNPKAAERFSEATQAYDLLSDKSKRAAFDRGEIDGEGNPRSPFGYGGGGGDPRGGFGGGGAGPGGQRFDFGGNGGVDLGDIFDGLFGGGGGPRPGPGAAGFGGARGGPAPKGANVAYRLTVSFVDAARGSPQRITLSDGKTIDLKLPAGVETGTQMRLTGKGQPGPGGAGDGIVTITVGEHPWFKRDGDNIRLELPITIHEALAGAKIKVPTVDGAVMLSIPPHSNSGKTLRLREKGWLGKAGKRGDQLVVLMIELPFEDADFVARLDGWADARNPRAPMGV